MYQYVFELRNRIEDTCKLARERTGDQALVLLSTDHNKLVMHWKGPYEVTKTVGVTDFQIRVKNNLRLFHVNTLKRYLLRNE